MRDGRATPFEPVFRDHWIILLPHFFITLLAAGSLFGVLLLEWVSFRVLALLALAAWGWFGFHFLCWRQRRYVLEHGRVHVLWGFLTLKRFSVQYYFPSLDLTQGPLGRLLNYGSLTVGTPPNDLHIPRLNNFSLVRARLFATRPQPPPAQTPFTQPPVIIQPPPLIVFLSPKPRPPRWRGGLPLHPYEDRIDGWHSSNFPDPYAYTYSQPHEGSAVSAEEWDENEDTEGGTTFHTSYKPIDPRLRPSTPLLDKLARSLRPGFKWGTTLLLDYLDAIGEGVILAAEWVYQTCLQPGKRQ